MKSHVGRNKKTLKLFPRISSAMYCIILDNTTRPMKFVEIQHFAKSFYGGYRYKHLKACTEYVLVQGLKRPGKTEKIKPPVVNGLRRKQVEIPKARSTS